MVGWNVELIYSGVHPLCIAVRFLTDVDAGIKHGLGNVHIVNSHTNGDCLII